MVGTGPAHNMVGPGPPDFFRNFLLNPVFVDRAGQGAGNPSFGGGAPDPQDMGRNGASYGGFVIDFGLDSKFF